MNLNIHRPWDLRKSWNQSPHGHWQTDDCMQIENTLMVAKTWWGVAKEGSWLWLRGSRRWRNARVLTVMVACLHVCLCHQDTQNYAWRRVNLTIRKLHLKQINKNPALNQSSPGKGATGKEKKWEIDWSGKKNEGKRRKTLFFKKIINWFFSLQIIPYKSYFAIVDLFFFFNSVCSPDWPEIHYVD